ncbi:hypothetical protein JSE7799_00100 [Jannaschia seosinensis]|uniref:Uncharacterized protein n=1 Tax=Jannaschia seosinensis TaxID=313367 RepID=A0A0M7B5E1_9RHOB|nr:hypothetical protein [Jannaschia seosinensis]CUH09474.1 hypothetical protein JSE7799_00100 [Jannaschia seosinensis]
MTCPRLIRIVDLRIDPVAGRLDAVAIRRDARGRLLRQPLSIAADPRWSHDQAVRAAERHIA